MISEAPAEKGIDLLVVDRDEEDEERLNQHDRQAVGVGDALHVQRARL